MTPPKSVGPDFCLVQLTAAGCAAAGTHSLRYSNGTTVYVFQPGEPIKVAKYEWQLALEPHTSADGKALFEIYTGPTQNNASVAPPSASTVATPAPAAAEPNSTQAQTIAKETK